MEFVYLLGSLPPNRFYYEHVALNSSKIRIPDFLLASRVGICDLWLKFSTLENKTAFLKCSKMTLYLNKYILEN